MSTYEYSLQDGKAIIKNVKHNTMAELSLERGHYIQLRIPEDTTKKYHYEQKIEFPLLNRFDLTSSIIRHTYVRDLNLNKKYCEDERKNKIINDKIFKWIEEKVTKNNAKKIKTVCEAITRNVSEETIKIHKRAFSACGPKHYSKIVQNLEKIKDKYFLKDLANYNAAHIVLSKIGINYELEDDDWVYPTQIGTVRQPPNVNQWRTIFSKDGKNYHNLSVTLDNLKTGLAPELILGLKRWKLERPIIEKMELVLFLHTSKKCNYLNYIGMNNYRAKKIQEFEENLLHIVNFATKDQIRKCAEKINRYSHQPMKLNKRNTFSTMSTYLKDFPEIHNGNIIGLIDKSIEWHRELAEQNINKIYEGKDKDTKVAIPPIPLLQTENVKFLGTIGEIQQEGILMGHCVGGYSNSAESGRCYLFHIQYKDNMATAEVDKQGRVVQCQGPKNQQNDAVKYGKNILSKWGKKFPETKTNSETEEEYYDVEGPIPPRIRLNERRNENNILEDDGLPF